jgi:hypothetical protein
VASATRRCEAALADVPLPLVSETLELALLWNAKAACTFAIKWLFFQEGVLDEALAYSPWVHHYRQQVYCDRPRYRDRARRIPALGDRVVKFVRDPFDRAVGAYLSYCRQASGWSAAQHGAMLTSIGRHLGRPVGDGQLFTFREFVSFLGSLDLASADIHVRCQTHPCERLGQLPQLSLVRVEEAASSLPALEDRLGLRRSDPASLRRSIHDTRRSATHRFAGDTPFGDDPAQVLPISAEFYDEALAREVSRLYAEDLERYGYRSPR